MYLKHFGINDYPFRLTPDTEYLYMSPAHSRAKAYMDYAIFNREGFVVITGDIGSGKTTLIKKLLSEIDQEKILVAKVFQTQLDEVEILQSILLEFGINPFEASKVELLNMINQFLINRYTEGKQILLIIDDAQNLSMRALKEVALLSGIETQKEKILHTILVGQSELNASLETPELEHLLQRVSFRYHVNPLSRDETINYIKYRLKVAGIDADKIMNKSVMDLIFVASKGIPRLINTLCDKSMTIAFADDKKFIGDEIFNDVIDELQWNKDFYIRKEINKKSNKVETELPAKITMDDAILKILQGISDGIATMAKQIERIADVVDRKSKIELIKLDNLDLDLSGEQAEKNTTQNAIRKKHSLKENK